MHPVHGGFDFRFFPRQQIELTQSFLASPVRGFHVLLKIGNQACLFQKKLSLSIVWRFDVAEMPFWVGTFMRAALHGSRWTVVLTPRLPAIWQFLYSPGLPFALS